MTPRNVSLTSKPLFVLLLASWGLTLLTQVLALASGATGARATWAVIAIAVTIGGAFTTVALRQQTA